jgi:hypothetical protein
MKSIDECEARLVRKKEYKQYKRTMRNSKQIQLVKKY